MTPSWYDLLDVDEQADDATIRAAWRTAIRDLDPTDRRFRVLNQAAEVLLDPTRRADHDRVLAAEAAESGSEESGASTRPVLVKPAPTVAAETGNESRTRTRKRTRPEPETRLAAKTSAVATRAKSDAGARGLRVRVPAWLIVVVGVLALVAAGLAAYAVTRPDPSAIESGASAAASAAETAVVPILSYDATDMEASQRAAHAYMTSTYATKDYDPFFAQLIPNAPGTGVKVVSTVVASAVVQADEGVVTVLVFVNRDVTNKVQTTPRVEHDQVTVTMVHQSGQWLVNKLTTTPVGST